MAEMRYNVVYRGKILQGFDIDAAKHKLITSFSISEEKAVRILKSRRVMLKKDADEAVAKKFGGTLKRAGLDIVLTRSTAGAVSEKQVSAPALKPPGKAFDSKPEKTAQNRDTSADQAAIEGEIVPASVSSRIPFEFHGTGLEYFKIWIVNIILSMATLGIYSAWAKVRRKQYFYGSTRIKAAGFEWRNWPIPEGLNGKRTATASLTLAPMAYRPYILPGCCAGSIRKQLPKQMPREKNGQTTCQPTP